MTGNEVPSKDQILDRLRTVIDPDLKMDLVSAGLVKKADFAEGKIDVVLELTTPACPLKGQFVSECKRVLGDLPGVRGVDVEITSRVATNVPVGKKPVPGIAEVVAVASGKGGVGKSTVAVGLALGLKREGATVDLLDADIYGPSLHVMMSGAGRLVSDGQGRIEPAVIGNIPMVSVGLLAEKGVPVIWRGPMVGKMIEELLFSVAWPSLDYLVVDLPPGTGDAQLTLAQKAPLAGAIMVTTPQDVALEDVERAARMFLKMEIPVIGIVENMSYFICPDCGRKEEIFSSGGGEALASRLGVPLLAQIPLATHLRVLADRGDSLFVYEKHPEIASEFSKVAHGVASALSILARKGSGPAS